MVVPQGIWMPSQSNHCLPLSQKKDDCELMTNPSMYLCARSLKTLRVRSTRQISPPWPLLPPRMARRFTSFPSLRSPCLSPNSLADPVRNYTTPLAHNICNLQHVYLFELGVTWFWIESSSLWSFYHFNRSTKGCYSSALWHKWIVKLLNQDNA